MSSSDLSIHANAAASGGLAAAIAGLFGCLFAFIFTGDLAYSLMWGAWGAVVAFGGTYEGFIDVLIICKIVCFIIFKLF